MYLYRVYICVDGVDLMVSGLGSRASGLGFRVSVFSFRGSNFNSWTIGTSTVELIKWRSRRGFRSGGCRVMFVDFRRAGGFRTERLQTSIMRVRMPKPCRSSLCVDHASCILKKCLITWTSHTVNRRPCPTTMNALSLFRSKILSSRMCTHMRNNSFQNIIIAGALDLTITSVIDLTITRMKHLCDYMFESRACASTTPRVPWRSAESPVLGYTVWGSGSEMIYQFLPFRRCKLLHDWIMLKIVRDLCNNVQRSSLCVDHASCILKTCRITCFMGSPVLRYSVWVQGPEIIYQLLSFRQGKLLHDLIKVVVVDECNDVRRSS